MGGARLTDDELTALVIAARAGERDAFGRLYGELHPVVRQVVRDNVHTGADIDDVVQEVFVRALRRLGSLREPARFRPWLLSIARRAAIDHRRVRVAGRVVPDAEVGVGEAAPVAGPDDAVAVRAELARVQRAVATLSPRDALALDLVGHLGFGPAEVGAVLGITPGAAKVVVHRARQRLHTLVGDAERA